MLPTLVVPRAHAMRRTMDLLVLAKADVLLAEALPVEVLAAVVLVEVDAANPVKSSPNTL
jgi:hypothetical protein